MSAREFREWQAYYRIRPWGDDWVQTGVIAASNFQPWTSRKVRPDQFVPGGNKERDLKAMEWRMHQWAKAHNAQVDRRERDAKGE